MQPDRGRGSLEGFNRKHVKPIYGGVHAMVAQKSARHTQEDTLLLEINRGFRRRKERAGRQVANRSGFYLDKGQYRPVKCHDIDFPLEPRMRVIPRNAVVALSAQIPVSVGLATNPDVHGTFFC